MYFDKLNTIVIKIGSSLIIDEKKKIRSKWLDSFVKDIQGFKKAGRRIIIVSSGAIALGCKKLNLDKKNLKINFSFNIKRHPCFKYANVLFFVLFFSGSEIIIKSGITKISIHIEINNIQALIFSPFSLVKSKINFSGKIKKVKHNNKEIIPAKYPAAHDRPDKMP